MGPCAAARGMINLRKRGENMRQISKQERLDLLQVRDIIQKALEEKGYKVDPVLDVGLAQVGHLIMGAASPQGSPISLGINITE